MWGGEGGVGGQRARIGCPVGDGARGSGPGCQGGAGSGMRNGTAGFAAPLLTGGAALGFLQSFTLDPRELSGQRK